MTNQRFRISTICGGNVVDTYVYLPENAVESEEVHRWLKGEAPLKTFNTESTSSKVMLMGAGLGPISTLLQK